MHWVTRIVAAVVVLVAGMGNAQQRRDASH